MWRNIAEANLYTNQYADDLSDHRARAVGTDDSSGKEQIRASVTSPSGWLASGARPWAIQSPRPDAMMMPISAETNAINGRMVFSTVSMVSRPGLEQHRHGGAHPHPDLRQQAVALLGDFLAGIVISRGHFLRRGTAIHQSDVVLFHARHIDVFKDVLCQRAGFAGGVDIHRRNTSLRIDAAAQRAAAVDHRHADFRFRRLTLFKAIDGFPAGQLTQLIDDRRARACGDVNDLFAFGGVELQRAAPATRAFLNADPVHTVAPERWTFCSSWIPIFFSKMAVVRSVTQPRKKLVTRPTSR